MSRAGFAYRAVGAVLLSIAIGAHAATITIVNLDGPGEGFNDATPVSPEGGNTGTTRGQQRLILFQAAANQWAARLTSNIAIKVGANFDPLTPCSPSGGVLGSAGPESYFKFTSPPVGYQANTWYSVAEAEAIQGTNINGGENEIGAQFNSEVDAGCLGAGTRFWYGITSASPSPGSKINLYPVILHELGHGLGFISLVCTDVAGCGGGTIQGSLLSGSQDIWNYFLKDGSSGQLWKDMSTAQRAASMENDQHLVWNGANVTASIPTFQPGGSGVDPGTGRIKMFAPSPTQLGSSVSHFDTTATSPNLLMEPNLSVDLFNNLDLTVPLFQDIGWVVTSGVNQAPTVTAPASITVTEDVASALSGLSFADVDAGSGSLTATFTVASGALNAPVCSGVTTGGTSSARTLAGTLANLNACLSAANLSFTTASNATSNVTLNISVNDNGNTGTGGAKTGTGSATLTVTAVNDAPSVTAPMSIAVLEDVVKPLTGISIADVDAGTQNVAATFGVASGTLAATSGGGVTVSGTATSRTLTGSVANVNAFIAAGALTFQTAPNSSSSVTLNIGVDDLAHSGTGGAQTGSGSLTLSVGSVNDAPTLAAISDPAAINEDAAQQTVNLSGIGPGPNESQALTVSASSGNPGLIPNPAVTYTSPNATGSLAYTPVAGASGSAVITVTVGDSGGTANGGVNTFARTFTVVVNAVNDAPSLDPIANPAAVLEDAAQQTINLAGIADGEGGTQVLAITASSNNPGLIPNPSVTYANPGTTGTLRYTPVANHSGVTTITVNATDNGGTANGGVNSISRTFDVSVTAVNDAPTLDPIGNATIAVDAGLQTVNLTGIDAGPVEAQSMTVNAVSDNPALIPNPVVVYTSPNATGSLGYTPLPAQSGIATITVTVTDNGGTANGGADTGARTFVVAVGVTIGIFSDGFE